MILGRGKRLNQSNEQIFQNAGLLLWFVRLALRWAVTPCGSACECVWSGKEKDCITGFKLGLRNDCSWASSVAVGHTDIQRGKPSGISQGFDYAG